MAKIRLFKKTSITLTMILLIVTNMVSADVNQAVDNFFDSISSNSSISGPTMVQNQSAGVMSLGGIATRSNVVDLNPVQFTPPSFNSSCGNINFYSGSLSFMTNTDQLLQFMQNTLMTAGITAALTALKSATPNIAGTIQSLFDAAQKMLNMFNNSCQLGMALGNSADSWMYDRLGKAKSQSYATSADASDAEINSTTGGSSGSKLADKMNDITNKYHDWVNKNAVWNPNDGSPEGGVIDSIANKYGSVIWKGLQALHLYVLPVDNKGQTMDVPSLANLTISLVGDLIIYPPNADGTGTLVRRIPPSINSIADFISSTTATIPTYNCSYFSTTVPGECSGTQVDYAKLQYPIVNYNGGIMVKIKAAMQHIEDHFTQGTTLNQNDYMIISISPIPIYTVAQTLYDIGMGDSINSMLNMYSEQIAFEILQRLIGLSISLANQATTQRTNSDTQAYIASFIQSITQKQNEINSYSTKYTKKYNPVEILQQLNFLKSYAQDLMSPEILQKVTFAKQLEN